MPPKFVRACIPTTAKAIPQGDGWLHEPKLDGYRFQIVKDATRSAVGGHRAPPSESQANPSYLKMPILGAASTSAHVSLAYRLGTMECAASVEL